MDIHYKERLFSVHYNTFSLVTYVLHMWWESKNHFCRIIICLQSWNICKSVKSWASFLFAFMIIKQYKRKTIKFVFDFYQVPILLLISFCFLQVFILLVWYFPRRFKIFYDLFTLERELLLNRGFDAMFCSYWPSLQKFVPLFALYGIAKMKNFYIDPISNFTNCTILILRFLNLWKL